MPSNDHDDYTPTTRQSRLQPRRRAPTAPPAEHKNASIAEQFRKVLLTPEPRRFGDPGKFHSLLPRIDGVPSEIDGVAIPYPLQRKVREHRERGYDEAYIERMLTKYVAAVKRHQQQIDDIELLNEYGANLRNPFVKG